MRDKTYSHRKRRHTKQQLSEHWLFGLHAVRDALMNPVRAKHKLIVTPNAYLKLQEAIVFADIEHEVADPRRFHAPLAQDSVHQGAALHTKPLEWGEIKDFCAPTPKRPKPLVLVLDRISDPHNVGAILRSAHAFGVAAVIAPKRHAAPETGALAKAASGALEKQPYIRINNLVEAMETLKSLGYHLYGLDAEAPTALHSATFDAPTAFVMGAEGPGLRDKTRLTCDDLLYISTQDTFSSLNVSNAAAISLHTASIHI